MSRQKRKAPKVEAWAVVPDGSAPTDFFLSRMTAKQVADDKAWPAEVVRLVPADPAKERVVRLERKAIALARVLVAALWGNGKPCAAGEAELRVTLARLTSAVEKFQKGRRK